METQKRTFREQGDHERPRQRKQPPLARDNGLGPCQVRIETETPCPYPATIKIRDVPFCERCVLKQEAYFAIGELTQSQAVDEESLAKALEGMKMQTAVGEVEMRADNHQLLQPLFVSTMSDKAKFDVEHTGIVAQV